MIHGQEKYRCTIHAEWKDCTALEYIIHNLDNSIEIILGLKSVYYSGETNEKC